MTMHYTLLFAARDKKAPIQLKVMGASDAEERDRIEQAMKDDWDLVRTETSELSATFKSEAK